MQLPSAVQQVNFNGYSISIKRDDLIDPFISGNKWRKLKYLLEDVVRQQKNHLVTFGGAYSNHLLATAAAAAKHGYKATAFVRGEEVHNPVLTLCKLFGMNLIFASRESYKDKQGLFQRHFIEDKLAYFIDEGGASAAAVEGCAEVVAELTENYDHIFCAAGTGTTAAGLLKGIQKHCPNSQLQVIPALKGGAFIRDEIAHYVANLSNLQLHPQYDFGGYAKTTPILIQFLKEFTAQTGILIDPVYNAKMFFAIDDLIAKKTISKHAKILAIHTGGLFGLLGMMDKIDHSFRTTLS